MHLHGFRAFACCWWLLSTLGTSPLNHPYLGCLPLITPPHSIVGSLCITILRDISILCGPFPFYWRVWGCSPITWGGLGDTSALQLSTCSFLYIFIVHYVSRFDHGSNYYASSYSGIFWLVFYVISDSGSFPDSVSSKPWHGSTTTLDAKGLWRCSWLSFCATAANSIFNASSSLCQLCYVFSTGRFLFQSWASHHFVFYICLVFVLVSAFYF